MALRSLYVAGESAENVLPTTFANVPVTNYTFKNNRNISVVAQTTGSRITARKRQRGHRNSSGTINTGLNFDTFGYFLRMHCGPPITTGVAGATGAYDHAFKVGGTVASGAFRYSRALGQRAEWWQILGNKINTLGLRIAAEEQPMAEMATIGRWGTKLASAPSALALEDAGYVQPAEIPQQSVTFDGVTWLELISARINSNNNLTPRHTIQTGADMRRIRIGDWAGDFDIRAEYMGYDIDQTVTATAATDLLTATAHGYTDGQPIVFANTGGAVPAGLTAGTVYYVRDSTTNTFKVAATVGGVAIDITDTGTGTHTVREANTVDLYYNFENFANPNNITIAITDIVSTPIGTGTPVPPSIIIAIPKILILAADLPDADTDTEVTASGQLGYDSSSATAMTITLRNEKANYNPS